MRWIRRQQSVQKGGSAARQPNNKERLNDFFGCDLRKEMSVPFHEQPVR